MPIPVVSNRPTPQTDPVSSADYVVAVLKKRQDAQKETAEAVVKLITPAPKPDAGRIDTFG